MVEANTACLKNSKGHPFHPVPLRAPPPLSQGCLVYCCRMVVAQHKTALQAATFLFVPRLKGGCPFTAEIKANHKADLPPNPDDFIH